MTSPVYALTRPLLFALPPEEAHEVTIRTLERGFYTRDRTPPDARLAVTVGGLTFPNPIGIAAGFDKDARVPEAVLGLGCGFAEVGTVTPQPQSGNPRPRVFRLVAEGALINRLGFNNAGHATALARLQAVRRRDPHAIVGVNIGANKDSADRVADYVAGIDAFYDVASYFMVNVSSPNTTGLRKLQDPANLDELLTRVLAARTAHLARGAPARPILVKISPDLEEAEIGPICARLEAHAVDGIAVANTTLARAGLARAGPRASRSRRRAREAGGLSGRPLFERSTAMLARVYRETGGRVPLIGIGGVDSGDTALAKIEAGASLVQLYTGLVYQGPSLIGEIRRALAAAVTAAGAPTLSALVGRAAVRWAEHVE
jgi:dihydroorotate dehydrogenase